MNRWIKLSIVIAVTLYVSQMKAQVNLAEEQAYCEYVTAQSKAQQELLRMPTAVAGVAQPESGLSAQWVAGASESLANLRKASTAAQIAKTSCSLYASATEARTKILFALPQIAKDTLQNRLILIEKTLAQFDELIQQNLRFVAAQNMTRPAVYALQAGKMRLVTDRTATLTGLATPYVPPQNPRPLRELLSEKKRDDFENQRVLNLMQKQNDWDVSLGAGVHHQIGNDSTLGASSSGAYATITLSYNLGGRAINRHLDQSLDAYDDWQIHQFDDVSHQADLLKAQIEESIRIQETQVLELTSQADEIARNLASIDSIDSDAARSFRNQLTADKLILTVDIEDARFRADRLHAYLSANF